MWRADQTEIISFSWFDWSLTRMVITSSILQSAACLNGMSHEMKQKETKGDEMKRNERKLISHHPDKLFRYKSGLMNIDQIKRFDLWSAICEIRCFGLNWILIILYFNLNILTLIKSNVDLKFSNLFWKICDSDSDVTQCWWYFFTFLILIYINI